METIHTFKKRIINCFLHTHRGRHISLTHTHLPTSTHTHTHMALLCVCMACVLLQHGFSICTVHLRSVHLGRTRGEKTKTQSVGTSHPTAVSTVGQEVNTSAGRTSTPPPPPATSCHFSTSNIVIISTPLRLNARQRSADRVLIKTMLMIITPPSSSPLLSSPHPHPLRPPKVKQPRPSGGSIPSVGTSGADDQYTLIGGVIQADANNANDIQGVQSAAKDRGK